MPQLTFKNIKRQTVLDMSKTLVDELQSIMNVPRDYFVVEHVDSMFIKDGGQAEEYPLVFVSMFDRGQEVEAETAKAITRHVQGAGYKDVDVIINLLERVRYYENGEHF